MISPYDSSLAIGIIEDLTRGNESEKLNTVYKSSSYKNLWYFCNSKMFYHLLRPAARKYDGRVAWYEIEHKMLTAKGELKDCPAIGRYKTKQELLDVLESSSFLRAV